MRHNLLSRRRPPWVAAALWMVVLIVSTLVTITAVHLHAQVRDLRQRVAQVQSQVATLDRTATEAERRAAPYRRAAQIASALQRQAIDPSILRSLEPRIPPDVWFTGITITPTILAADGRSLTVDDIASAVVSLGAAPGIAAARVTVVTRSRDGTYQFHVAADQEQRTASSPPRAAPGGSEP